MGLRDLAQTDLGIILDGDAFGFRWPITVTNPAGVSNNAPLYGFSNDISLLIDPDTGQPVSGRLATAVIRIEALTTAGLGLPVGIVDLNSKPWVVEFNDINGNAYTFKVNESNPDRAAGCVVCILETYNKP